MTAIILDTDPGGDDIFALLWLLSLVKQARATLVAVTSTAGNVSAQQTFRNASQILKFTGFSDLEVGRGVPLNEGVSEDAAHIHGQDGMGGLSHSLPPPTHNYETARSAEDVLIDRLTAAPGTITVVAIGPLTNLAAAEAKSPGILKQAREIVIMGGAFYTHGNVTPHAEFNIWFNPVAAQVVFNSRNDIVVLPLDVTQHLILTRDLVTRGDRISAVGAIPNFLTKLCELMTNSALRYRETQNIPGFLVHDAVTLGYLFYPETLTLRRANVNVETQGEWTRGQTLIDDRARAKTHANAWVALQIDQVRFFTCLVEDLCAFH